MANKAMPLFKLFKAAGIEAQLPEGRDPLIKSVFDNSRLVETGSLFVATRGSQTDSHLFISDAVERGVAAVVVERDTPDYDGVVIIRVDDSRDALGRLAHAYYGNPTADMLVFGISGTNGKTTTTYLMESILTAAGYKPGVIGTIEARYDGKHFPAANTTPTALQLASLLADMKAAGVNAVAMEASSHAMDQRRISGIQFDCAVLTNVTQDHLDYHGTREAYAEAKRLLYADHLLRPKTGANRPVPTAIFNSDDETGRAFAEAFSGAKVTFGLEAGADVHARDVTFKPSGVSFTVDADNDSFEVESRLLGMFNVQNILGALAAALAMGLPREQALAGIRALENVRGRFEVVDAGQPFTVVVDYAHTPDALERIIQNAREMTTGRVITVFGCGGDRDNTKRPIMGRTAATLSDLAIVTSDNPRTEDPAKIAVMVVEGVRQAGVGEERSRMILDRRAAIGEAIATAAAGDIVVIAGKGHEDYQILGTEKIHFDDVEVAREFLAARGRQ